MLFKELFNFEYNKYKKRILKVRINMKKTRKHFKIEYLKIIL